VFDQVAALRKATGIDARVVSCRPFWLSTIHPGRVYGALRAYRAAFRRLRWTEWEGVPVLYPPYLVGGLIRFPLHGPTYLQAVLEALRSSSPAFQFELVHAHTGYLDGLAGLRVARAYGVPLVITEHTGPFSVLVGKPGVREMTLHAMRGADTVLCVSEFLRSEVASHLPRQVGEKIRVLPNGIDLTQFRPGDRRPDPARPGLLAVGSIDANTNHALLLSAMEIVLARIPGATLTVIGEGPLRETLSRQVREGPLRDAVRFVGARSREEVAKAMRDDCDLLIVASQVETFGVVAIEAFASGKPVVSTRCGGPESLIREAFLGRLCDHTPAARADAILSVVASPGRHPRDLIREHASRYDIGRIALQLADRYREVVGAGAEAR